MISHFTLMQAMEFFLCVFMLFASQAVSESDCEFTVNNVGYDLNKLVNFGGGAYNVQDSVRPTADQARHTYWFNFCGNINPPTDNCKQTDGTTQNYGSSQHTPKTACDPDVFGDCAAPVFQTYVNPEEPADNVCYRLAKKFSENQKANATFYSTVLLSLHFRAEHDSFILIKSCTRHTHSQKLLI